MSVKSKEEIISALNERFGTDDSDEVLAIIEDVTDTLTDAEIKAKGDGTDWKKKYEENDKEWRQRYKERFVTGGTGVEPTEPKDDDPDEPPKFKTFDDLFETKGE